MAGGGALNVECVLLLQNVFSYDGICSLWQLAVHRITGEKVAVKTFEKVEQILS